MPAGVKPMKNSPISSTRKRRGLLFAVLVLLTLLAALCALSFGSVTVSPADMVDFLMGKGNEAVSRIFLYSRLPRTCAAMLAGAALAVSGAVIQTVLNNPLASPGIIGVNAGAGLAVAILCAVLPAAQRFSPLAAMAGALTAVLIVLGLTEYTGASRRTLVLAGVAIANLFSAGIDAVVTFVPEALTGVTDFRIGGFSGVTMSRLTLPSVLILASLLLVLSLTPQLDILALGSDTAASLGLNVRPVRFVLLLLSAALAGAAVSFAGLLGFAGLIVPHAMRRLAGEESLPLVAASALGGAFFVTVCDLISRLLFAPFELPVGVILAFAGVPFFIWLLFRQRGGRS